MQLYNCQGKELTKSKTFYKSLLDMEDDVRIYIYGSRDKDTNCRTRYLLSVSPENNLTPTTSLQLYHTDRELKDFINNRGYGSSSI
ncbi:hypothetical protein M9Y10_020329 [Tritrichomonas musculus]|uniref:Uncharacterized protein n=1 Tax=Tritrichomonas musculus TaxID=1915356 RepID=A0ABR2HFW7_9EUKA